jgi:hypothetical protein
VGASLELWGQGGRELRSFDSEQVTVGTGPANALIIEGTGASRVHAVLERVGIGLVRSRSRVDQGVDASVIPAECPIGVARDEGTSEVPTGRRARHERNHHRGEWR